jgi:hypothetical protein
MSVLGRLDCAFEGVALQVTRYVHRHQKRHRMVDRVVNHHVPLIGPHRQREEAGHRADLAASRRGSGIRGR